MVVNFSFVGEERKYRARINEQMADISKETLVVIGSITVRVMVMMSVGG